MAWSSQVRRIHLLIFLCAFSTELTAELPPDSYELRRSRAYNLTDDHSPEAEQALLALLKERPGDGGVLFALGRVAFHDSGLLEAGARRRETRRKARDYFLQAQKSGYNDPLIATAMAAINPDGSENVSHLSQRKEVDQLLQEGEKLFGQRKFIQAAGKYRQAFELEPSNYLAALYTGDAYFASGAHGEALAWFDKATALEPNREVGHRYAGDVLLRTGRRPEALQRYLSAAVAEPYNGYPWRALNEFCKGTLIKQWTAPANVPSASITASGKKKDIGLPEGFTPFDLIYASARITWQNENNARKFPTGTEYRLTLEEEAYALHATLKSYAEIKQAKTAPPAELAAALEKSRLFYDHLLEIEDAGLIKAHILLVRGNADLAQDYTAYREAHRDELLKYLAKFYLHLE